MNRESRSERRGYDFDRSSREMHTIICADCGKEDQVPFKPDGTRLVYCRECYQKHRPKGF
jgi:CxxC-x17-CxxC domain-containing protein